MRYFELVGIYQELEHTTKRLEKTDTLVKFLKSASKSDLKEIIYLLQGKVFPLWDERKIGMSSKLMLRAISSATGNSKDRVEKMMNKIGDLGKIAEELISKKKQMTLHSKQLEVKDVFNNIRKLAELEGAGTVNRKIQLVSELLTSAKPIEARFIVRTVLEELRVGVAGGTIRDSIANAFNQEIAAIDEALDLLVDYGEVAVLAKENKLKNLKLEAGRPIKLMLAIKVDELKEAFEKLGKPIDAEYKYDGFRCVTGYTPIYTLNKGLVSMRDVRKGDFVFTHKGNFKEVVAVNKRKIDKKERLFMVQSFLGNEFKITEKHNVLVKEKDKIKWINSERLGKNCNLIFPIPKIDSWLPFKNKLVLEDEAGYKKIIRINNDFFKFLGYWVGDGFTNNYHNTERIGLIFNKEKGKKLCELYEKVIRNNFRIQNISKNIHNGAIYLYWRDKRFRIWLSRNFRKEWKGKILPKWFFGVNKEQFLSFMRGWVESDGYKDDMGRISVTTKERELAMIVQFIALRFGIVYAIKKIRVNGKTYFKVIITKSDKYHRVHKDHIEVKLLRFKEIKHPDPRTTLYNLQVKGDKSYCTTLISLHNCQIHKINNKIMIFTRRLENVTNQFPDLVKYVRDNVKGDSFIIDLEAVGFDVKTKKYLPFQNISQRIKRKYAIEDMAKKFPVVANVFDIVYYNGRSLIEEPFKKRRVLLEKIIKEVPMKIVLARNLISSDEKEIEKFFKESLKDGNEGIMLKKVDAKYKAGRYVGYMIKFKPSVENLDLVIIGGEWGEGKRAKWLSSFILGCKSEGKFLEVGKVGTGIKEKDEEGVTFEQLTKLLLPLITRTKGKEVEIKPKVIVEVGYEEIQKSPTYSSGYGLRFPRVIRLRDDKGVDEINSLDDVKKFYNTQRK